MEVISANPEFRYIRQPFSAYAGNGKLGLKRACIDYGRYIDPTEKELERIGNFVTDLLEGRQRTNGPADFWHPNFWHKKTRAVLKILQAKSLMPWFEENFNLEIIYLIRHPIAQAASVVKARWSTLHQDFLGHPTFSDKFLSAEQRRYCEKVSARGSVLELQVLSWCLDNLVPLHGLSQHSWLVLSYEDCVLNPENTIIHLSEKISISDKKFMSSQIGKPSGTSKITNDRGADVSSDAQLTKWSSQFSEKDVRKCFEILLALEIDVYNESSPVPSTAFKSRAS